MSEVSSDRPAAGRAPQDPTPSGGSSSDGTPSDGAPSDRAPSDWAPSDWAPSDGAPSDGERRLAAGELAAARSGLSRALWAALGLTFVGVGGLGVVVPGLPTTPFLLLAAACFARSSPRLYAWLLRNPTFGPLIEDFRAGRGVSMRVKVTALSMMAAFVTFALLVPLRGKLGPTLLVAAVAAVGAAYILRLPTRRAE